MVAIRRIIFKRLPSFCHLRIKNKVIPRAIRNPLLLLAKRREKVKKQAKKRAKKKPAITSSDSGAKKTKRPNQTNQKKIVKMKVGKKSFLLLIDSIIINLML